MPDAFPKHRPGSSSGDADPLAPILIADDDAVTRTFLKGTLQSWGYSVQVARDGLEAWHVLSPRDGPVLAILDWMMPGLDGPALCRKLRELEDRYVYVILLTAKTEKRDLVLGLEAGADDYVIKPFDAEELRARLRAGSRIAALERELRIRATRDALTGVWTRGAVLQILSREIERARRSAKPLSLLLADLDHFKGVNDEFGHPAGDAVLREVALQIQRTLRVYDSVGRYGGEELLMVLPECDGRSLASIAERVRLAIAAQPITHGSHAIPVTVSIGGVTASAPLLDADSMIAAADRALYRAKSLGRNRTEFAALETP